MLRGAEQPSERPGSGCDELRGEGAECQVALAFPMPETAVPGEVSRGK